MVRSISSATIWVNAVGRPCPLSFLPVKNVTSPFAATDSHESSCVGGGAGHGEAASRRVAAPATSVREGIANETTSAPAPAALRKSLRSSSTAVLSSMFVMSVT